MFPESDIVLIIDNVEHTNRGQSDTGLSHLSTGQLEALIFYITKLGR
jgi:hypothetical protein